MVLAPEVLNLTSRIDGLNAEPWIGQRFSGASFRPFFVGHSHYDEGSDGKTVEQNMTHGVIQAHENEEISLRFFTGLMQMATGLHHDYVDRTPFYERIGFANLLQTYLEAARMAADPKTLKADTAALTSVFDAVNPTHIILLGDQVWNAFFESGELVPDPNCGESHWSGHIGNRPAFGASHPSSAFSGLKWAMKYGRFLRDNEMEENAINGWVDEVRYQPESNLLKSE